MRRKQASSCEPAHQAEPWTCVTRPRVRVPDAMGTQPDFMIFQAILVVLFLALAGLLLWLPERHFGAGNRNLRIVGAVAFLIAAVATLVSIIAG
jgi:hypothetical protein